MSDLPHENVDVFLAYALKVEQEAALRRDRSRKRNVSKFDGLAHGTDVPASTV